MTTLNHMVKQVAGLEGTTDVSDWESDFIHSVVVKTENGKNTTSLTERQITVLEALYGKHCTG